MQKWYLAAIVAVVAIGVGAITVLDQTQPGGVNVELTNKIIGIVTAVLPVLLLQLSNSSKIEEAKREVIHGQEAIKDEIPGKVADKLIETGSVPAPPKVTP